MPDALSDLRPTRRQLRVSQRVFSADGRDRGLVTVRPTKGDAGADSGVDGEEGGHLGRALPFAHFLSERRQ